MVCNQVINLLGFKIQDDNKTPHVINDNLILNPNRYIVLARSQNVNSQGFTPNYIYGNSSGISLSNSSNEIKILNYENETVTSASYNDLTFPDPNGKSIEFSIRSIDNDNTSSLNRFSTYWKESQCRMLNGDYATPGAGFHSCSNSSLKSMACSDNFDNDFDGYVDCEDNDCSCPVPDEDSDLVPDEHDNCPSISNLDQIDSDGDNIGDVCDNCPSVPNFDQNDADGDGNGDLCSYNFEDVYEPNNTIVDAFVLSTESIYDLTISYENDDWFVIPIVRGAGIIINVSFQHIISDLDIRLYNESGDLLVSSTSSTDNEIISLSDIQHDNIYL